MIEGWSLFFVELMVRHSSYSLWFITSTRHPQKLYKVVLFILTILYNIDWSYTILYMVNKKNEIREIYTDMRIVGIILLNYITWSKIDFTPYLNNQTIGKIRLCWV